MVQIVTVNEVSEILKKYRDKKIVVAGGCFDILHLGHITLLENAKKEGDVLCILLENDSSIKKRKGIDRPIHSQQERAHIVSQLRSVDIIILLPDNMSNNDYDNLLEVIHPSVIATTENDTHIVHKKRQAEAIGATVKQVNKYIPSVSTTKLLDILSKEI